ncbi:MAG TPA: hypothetical protein GX708_12040 [Gallicola sp.]|nr:hypothetical protein [Gallicola sp.]
MDLIKEIKEIKKQLSKLEKFAEEEKKAKQLTISDIKVGEQFVYGDKNYTKLNEECFVIIDDFIFDFMYCIFDPITNNYDESLVRYYINSDRFIKKLGVDKQDIKNYYLNDYITLLSKEEFYSYEELIRDYGGFYWTRFASSSSRACVISSVGNINAIVSDANRVRVCFTLKPNTPVSRKVDE